MKIQTAQLAVRPGQIRENFRTIEKEIARAKKTGADILILPEMCLSGYLIGDLWDQNAFLRECEAYNEKIASAAQGLAIIWGSVAVDFEKTGDDGRPRKYNAAFVAANGNYLRPEHSPYPFTPKTLLPAYRQFDDRRYFTGAEVLAREEGRSLEDFLSPFAIPTKDGILRAGVLLCEDSWDENYETHPMDILATKRTDLLVNLSASPLTLGKNDKRHRMLGAALSRLGVPMLYVNHRGIQNNGKNIYTFDGMTAAYDKEGHLIAEAAPFETPRSAFLFTKETKTLRPTAPMPPTKENLLLPTLRYGLSQFLETFHMERVVVGVSGGIDSAVNAALFASVLPAENLLLVNTPTRYNSETTKSLAAALAQNLGAPYVTIPIGDATEETAKTLAALEISRGHKKEAITVTPLMHENIQARDRSARILAALSASVSGIFTCNANKTELTVGYATLYGDMAGAIAATADLWKHQIYALGRTLNEHFGREIIPKGSFTVTPSAELSDAQNVDRGQGDPLIYDYHDYLFRAFIEPWQRATPEDILEWYLEGKLERKIGTPLRVRDIFPTDAAFIADLERWWNLFSGFSVAKRIQSPPILSISRRPYGYDLRESQLAPYYTDKYWERKKQLLEGSLSRPEV